MPILIKAGSPVASFLENENVHVRHLKTTSDFPVLDFLVVNLSPNNPETEVQVLRLLSNTPLDISPTLLHLPQTLIAPPTAPSTSVLGINGISGSNGGVNFEPLSEQDSLKFAPLKELFADFLEIQGHRFDGAVIVGGNNETVPFEQLWYWREFTDLLKFAKTTIRSTLFIGWAAQAGLFFHYGIGKGALKEKLNGLYQHRFPNQDENIIRGLDSVLTLPHLRTTGLDEHALANSPQLETIAFGTKARSSIIKSRDEGMLFFTGRCEHDEDTLHKEYLKSLRRGLRVKKPTGYYCHGKPRSKWRSSSSMMVANWIKFYIYDKKFAR